MQNVSIVIPHYEKQDALQVTWDSLRLQLHPDDEVLIVDDYSPNGVPDLNCPCTRIVKPPPQSPHIYRLNTLRNVGISWAKYDPIIILDPDCIPNQRFLDYARKIFDPVILYGGHIQYLDQMGGLDYKDPRSRHSEESIWSDHAKYECGLIWGGCMMFSKTRTQPLGWFDTDFDGVWGAEDASFACHCIHTGMRTRYEKKLTVYHQWHPKTEYGDRERNVELHNKKRYIYENHMNLLTDWKPAVAVLCVTTGRPYYIDQALRSVFRHNIPLKVRLVSNGDQSKEQRVAVKYWRDKWAVDFKGYEHIQPLANIRTETMQMYREKNYKYLILMDDDITPIYGSIPTLIREMEAKPWYYAIAGYIIDYRNTPRFIGGRIKNGQHYYYTPVTAETYEADYISSGFTIMRLNKIIPYGKDWEFGWNDWDWSNTVKSMGKRVAVTGLAGAYHKYLWTEKGRVYKEDPLPYKELRRDNERHERMAKIFGKKWGYTPKPPKPITVMPCD